MEFNDVLNEYMEILGCSSKELAKISNISPSLISRYKNGDRIPKYDSEQYQKIILGLSKLSNNENINYNTIKEKFDILFNNKEIDFNLFINNFNIIISHLNINISELSKYIGFDSSYISKIRNGVRKPHNVDEFINSICEYILHKYNSSDDKNNIKNLINCNDEEINNNKLFKSILYKWLCNNEVKEDNQIDSFLLKLDNFDLNEYIKKTKFDKIKVPTIPIQFPKTKSYYGLEGFKNAQLDILKHTILSRSKEDIFFYSNLPMIEASKDIKFTKNFMISLAFILKKGLTLNIIHNIDRPLKEIILGLEGWIPLYMTGQIKPYYLKDKYKNIYNTLECVSGSYSLFGICLHSDINNTKMYLSNKKDDLLFHKKNVITHLKKAKPLMNIYNKSKEKEFKSKIKDIINIEGKRINIYSKLPIYTISNKLLDEILSFNNINEIESKKIINYVNECKKNIDIILKTNEIEDEISILSKKKFNESPISLSLSNIFIDKNITYTYEQYLKHIEETKNFNKKNYKYIINNNQKFNNINIHIIEKKLVIISKENIPSIHFVINNKKLVGAIESIRKQG